METPLQDESAAGAIVEETEKTDQKQELACSAEALIFLSGIEPEELQRCVFSDSLATMSEGGRNLGDFNVKVEFARRDNEACMRVHAQSSGTIDDCPCGTSLTAFLTTDLQILEEDYHQFIKLKSHSIEKRWHMVQRDDQMTIEKATTEGQKEIKDSVSYPLSDLRGLVTEGSSLLLMRLIAFRKEVPENTTFVSLDQQLRIVHSTFSVLGLREMEVRDETLEVFGVERTLHSGNPIIWQSFYMDDGHMARRVQVGSPVTMRLLKLPAKIKEAMVLEDDMEMESKFSDIKEEMKSNHTTYMRQHPEIRALITDFLQFLLLRKPDDVVQFAREYFFPFASRHPPEPNTKTQSL